MYLLHNLLHFGELLHAAGMDVPAGRMIDVAKALEFVDVGRRTDFYITLRSLLIHRPQDFPLFDAAFRTFWRRPHGEWSTEDLRAMGERRRLGPPQVDIPPAAAGGTDRAGSALPDPVERIEAMSYSDREVSRTKDFAEFTDAELEEARRALALLSWDAGERRTRRWLRARRGRSVDLRDIVRHNARYGGELIDLPVRARKIKRRPLVLICDVSGSMERYARMLLHFVHGLSTRAWRVESFVFSTRLTRLTRAWKHPGAQTTVQRIPWSVPDWGGGTR